MNTGSRRRNGRQTALGLAASTALHLGVIAFLVCSVQPTPADPDSAPVEISLWSPRPAPRPSPRRLIAGARSSPELSVHTPALEPSSGATAPLPLPVPSGETVHATDAVRGLLRASVGCDHPSAFHLTADELDQCSRRARRLGEGEPVYAVRPHDPRKLAAFDQAARENEAERRAREGPMGVPIPVCSGPGSNFGGGCLSPHYKKGVQGSSEADQRSVWH